MKLEEAIKICDEAMKIIYAYDGIKGKKLLTI